MSSPKKPEKKKTQGTELNADGTKKKVEPKYVPMECVISAGIHPSSSESWGSDACAKIFSHVVEANDGREQMIVENKKDFLELYSKEELEKPDDLGNTLQFLAVYHDRPEMLRYLYARGIDLSNISPYVLCLTFDYNRGKFVVFFQHKVVTPRNSEIQCFMPCVFGNIDA